MHLAPASSALPPVLVVGDVMLDRYLHGAAERISPEAPVPVLHVRRSFERPGGAEPKRIAILGNAAGTIARTLTTLRPDLEVDGVSMPSAVDHVAHHANLRLH